MVIDVIFVKKSFLGYRTASGDGKYYEAGKYYSINLEYGPYSSLKQKNVLDFIDVIGTLDEYHDHGYAFIDGHSRINNLNGDIRNDIKFEPAGIRVNQQGRMKMEDGSVLSGRIFEWDVIPEVIDHQTLNGKYKISGPFGCVGYIDGDIDKVCEKVKNFINSWGATINRKTKEEAKVELAQLINAQGNEFFLQGLSSTEKIPTDGGMIETSQFQSWKIVALMKGLGFNHIRKAETDLFVIPAEVNCVYDGWEPSKDGSRLSDWSDLSDPTSAQFGRRYVTAFSFITQDGYKDVIAWESSPHNSEQLYAPIGLSSFGDWKRFVKDEPEQFGLSHWLIYNKVDIY